MPVAGVVSDGQHSVRRAVRLALPGVPHQLCQFHYLREAALPIFEADRHAKKELKKRVRGVRPIERSVEGRDDPEAEAVRGYCAAVRSAITDDGRPPLAASGSSCATGSRRSAPASTGWRKKGADAAPAALAPAARGRAGAHRELGRHPPRLRLGRTARPGSWTNAAGRDAAAVAPPLRRAASPPSAATAPRPARSPAPSTTSSR